MPMRMKWGTVVHYANLGPYPTAEEFLEYLLKDDLVTGEKTLETAQWILDHQNEFVDGKP